MVISYDTGITYAKRVCDELDAMLDERYAGAEVTATSFVNGRETGMMLRCRRLGKRPPAMVTPFAWVYDERYAGALEVVLGDSTHDYELDGSNMYYDWAYEHDCHTFSDDLERTDDAREAAELILSHFEEVCEEYARPDWMP